MKTLVSFIVPAYNSSLYVSRCIDSLLKQPFSFEIVVINDGSTDETHNVLKNYSKLTNVRYINCKKNYGVSHARNLGIKKACGDYIVFVDSDDYLKNCQRLKAVLSKNYDMIVFGRIIGYDNYSKISKLTLSGEFEKNNLLNENLDIFLKPSLSTWVTNKFYKTSIIRKNKIKFNEKINFGEDLLFNLKFFQKCKNIFIAKEYLSFYNRSNANSLSRQHEKHNISEVFWQREKVLKYLRHENLKNLENYYKDTKNILIYAIKKVLNTDAAKKNKILELEFIKKYSTKTLNLLNVQDNFEKLIYNFWKNNDLEILEYKDEKF